LRRGAVHRQVLAQACHLVRQGRLDAGDIFPEVRLRAAMASRHAAHRDEVVQVPLPDESSEVRRDEVVRQSAVHRGEGEIFGLAAEERLRVAHQCPFPMALQDFPQELQPQAAVAKARLAALILQAEVERRVGAQTD
jgi:hypothetical protein